MKIKRKNERARAACSPINHSLIPIEVRRWRRARLGLDPSGHGPNFELTLPQILEGSRQLALERLGKKKTKRSKNEVTETPEISWDELLRKLKAFGESCKSHVRQPKVRMV